MVAGPIEGCYSNPTGPTNRILYQNPFFQRVLFDLIRQTFILRILKAGTWALQPAGDVLKIKLDKRLNPPFNKDKMNP